MVKDAAIDWTDSELEAAVDAYLWMLGEQSAGRPYSKAEINRELRHGRLASRTKSSIEYRMQNISAALEELCLPHIVGYLPAKNIGTGVKDRIRSVLIAKKVLSSEDYASTSDGAILELRVSRLRGRPLTGTPRGNLAPKRVENSGLVFARDPLVKAWILENAKGICEACRNPAPFSLDDGTRFLEVHHVRALADGGTDRISNAVALCPNCHRRCHLSSDRETLIAALYQTIGRLAPE